MKDHKILIVEDESLTRESLKKILAELGFNRVIACANGYEAIDIVRQETVDLIIMDISLGEKLDGIDTAKLLKNNTPLIYISATKNDDTFARISETNSYGFLAKPLTGQVVKTAIENALGLGK